MGKVGNNTSAMLILNTAAPQGCVVSPLLYSLFTHDCLATHVSNLIIKFANDTTVVGLITNNYETAYREVRALAEWCQENNLSLNVSKMKELIVDFRRQQREHTTITSSGLERVKSIKFPHVPLQPQEAEDTRLGPKTLKNLYRCTIDSFLSGCITAWYSNCTTLKRAVCTTHHQGQTTCSPGQLQHPMSQEGQKDHVKVCVFLVTSHISSAS